MSVVVLRVGGEAAEELAVATECVREVAALGLLTPVPTAPAAVLGVTQVRGQILPVLQLAPGAPPRPGDALLVVEDGMWRAALVGEVLGVRAEAGAARAVDLVQLFGDITAAMTTPASGG